jgi:rhodanese-related sulfurtransferase
MDDGTSSISPLDLYARLGSALAPTVVDVRRDAPGPGSGRMVVSAFYCAPEEVKRWSNVTVSQPVVVYCSEGHDVSQSVARALRAVGIETFYLQGGIAGWIDQGLPTRRVGTTAVDRWVTRERPKVDRIACPWLIKRFIDPRSEFLYVPAEQVLEVAKATGATPYDIKGVEFGHHGDRCSFDAIVSTYDIKDPALDHLALIVRGADTSRPDLAPQCQGLLALSHGLSSRFADDHEQLKQGMIIYDAFYQWCRLQQEIIARTTVPIHSNGVVH